jgi:hypothetical protein
LNDLLESRLQAFAEEFGEVLDPVAVKVGARSPTTQGCCCSPQKG